jgi:hypothetical protein
MEGLKKRVIALGVLFLASGLAFQAMAGGEILHDGKVPDEKWLESVTTRTIPKYTFATYDAGPDVSYRMTDETYETLDPYGIVARVFYNVYERYDTVVIMSNKKDSFHDPRQCFTSQGWRLESEKVMPVETKTHGRIEVTLAELQNATTKGFAAFFYRGPNGFVPTANDIKSQMFWHQWKNFKDSEGVFYRIIPLHPNATKEQLAKFIDVFLQESDKASKGIL